MKNIAIDDGAWKNVQDLAALTKRDPEEFFRDLAFAKIADWAYEEANRAKEKYDEEKEKPGAEALLHFARQLLRASILFAKRVS